MIDVTVKSTSPMRKIRLGSVQELENVLSSIMAKNYSVFGVEITIYGSESLGLHSKL